MPSVGLFVGLLVPLAILFLAGLFLVIYKCTEKPAPYPAKKRDPQPLHNYNDSHTKQPATMHYSEPMHTNTNPVPPTAQPAKEIPAPVTITQQPTHATRQASASPSEVIPEPPTLDGDWEWDAEAKLYWSETECLYFDPKTSHSYDPKSGQWYDPESETWYHSDK